MTADGKDWQQSYDAMRGLLEGKRPDGVFCYNDPMALAAIEVALEAGLRIPEDIAFIGCDNLHYDRHSKRLSRALITIAVRWECVPRRCC